MTALKDFLKSLISAPGLSGYEPPIRKIIESKWEALTDELSVSRIGSLHGLKRGTGSGARHSILIATHMDAIGLMVTQIVDGFLYVTDIGGIDPRVLPGQPVTVHGREDLPAMVVQPPIWLRPKDRATGPAPLDVLLVETGLPVKDVETLVRPGDLISFAQKPLDLQGEVIAGHSLDNRASVAALTHCLEILQTRKHTWDVWAVATVQEEETLGGAATSGFALRPDIAVAVDVTFGKSPGTPGHLSYDLGKGPILGWGPNIHSGIYKAFKKTAAQMEMSFEKEILPRNSGTDAISLQVARAGIPTMVISIPLRYMHTPVEMIDMRDVKRVGRLMAEFITGLDEAFMKKLSWDEE